MRIQVLGNVAAFSDSGAELALGGPKQRTVLAMLCRNPGVTVSADDAMDYYFKEALCHAAKRGQIARTY